MGRLRDAGLECALADESTVQLNWIYSNAIGGIRLLVREEDSEEALRILDEEAGPTEEQGGGT